MEALKCPHCGANIKPDQENEYLFCPYCGVAIPKTKENANLFIKNTNQAVTVIQTPSKSTVVDKFLEHRRELRVLKAEERISKAEEARRAKEVTAELQRRAKEAEAEQKRLEKEAEKEVAAERRKAAEAEARTEAEKRKKAWGCGLILLSPILIPIIYLILRSLGVIDSVRNILTK